MPATRFKLELQSLEYEIGGVELTVRMRIRYAYGLAAILENQHVFHFRAPGKLRILPLPFF
jgi:hypothetical protein